MKPSDVRLIDPTFGKLATAVLQAAKVANGRVRHDRIDKDTLSWHRSLRRVWRKASGRQQWPNQRWPLGAPVVRLAWWTDRLGRKHWRVQGTRRSYEAPHSASWGLAKHDLWHVYPDRLLARAVDGREEVLAACGCGVIGTPEAISWTGERCGPCHDRLEEGLPIEERPFKALRKRHTSRVFQVAFLPDGRMVSGGSDGRVVLWEADGTSRDLLHRPRGFVQALAASANGVVAASTAHNRLMLRDVDGEEQWRTVALPGGGYYGLYGLTFAFSPEGEWLYVGSGNRVFRLDPAAPEPAPRPLVQGQNFVGAAIAADGQALYCYQPNGTLVRVAVPSGDVTTVREAPAQLSTAAEGEDQFELFLEDELDGVPAMACSPDGQWLVTSGVWDGWAGLHRCHLPTGGWAPLQGRPAYGVRSLAFTGPDELTSTCGDGSVAVWSLEKPALRASWWPASLPYYGGAFLSPEGEWLVHAHQEGTLEVLGWKELIAGAG